MRLRKQRLRDYNREGEEHGVPGCSTPHHQGGPLCSEVTGFLTPTQEQNRGREGKMGNQPSGVD